MTEAIIWIGALLLVVGVIFMLVHEQRRRASMTEEEYEEQAKGQQRGKSDHAENRTLEHGKSSVLGLDVAFEQSPKRAVSVTGDTLRQGQQ